jgi:hypothetical protein
MLIAQENKEIVLRLPPYSGHSECHPCKDELLKKREFTQVDIDIIVNSLDHYFGEKSLRD